MASCRRALTKELPRASGAGHPTRLLASGVARVPAFSDPPFYGDEHLVCISFFRTAGTPPTRSAHHNLGYLHYPSHSLRSVQMAGLWNRHCVLSNYRRYGGGEYGPQATPHKHFDTLSKGTVESDITGRQMAYHTQKRAEVTSRAIGVMPQVKATGQYLGH